MKKWMLVHIMLLLCGFCTAQTQDSYTEKANHYIEQHKALAIAEQQRSGIPAAITLGQGILETSAGCSELMTKANNHFGIKCKKEWKGETFAHTDDAPNECFRKYSCALDSYKDHSDYLKNSPRYASLFTLAATDYAGWAHGLKRCGYATNPRYAQQLIKIIDDFHLQDYTFIAMNESGGQEQPVAIAVVPQQNVYKPEAAAQNNTATSSDVTPDQKDAAGENGSATTANGLRAFYAHKGDVLLEAAIRYKMRYARLLELNDLPDAPLEADMFIYLEKKNSRGTHSSHIVQQGETLLQIAQAEGMQLKQLRSYNQLAADETPVMGTVLQLQEPGAAKPQVTTASASNAGTTQQDKADETVYIYKKKTTPAQESKVVVTEEVPAVTAVVKQVPASEPKVAVTQEAPAATVVVKQPVPARIEETPQERVVPVAKTKPVPVAKEEPAAFNIANEKAVEETVVRNNPRYVDRGENNDAAVTTQPAETTTPAAPASVVTTTPEQPAKAPEAEPQDELERLKAKLDKVVYAQGSKTKMTATSQTPADVKMVATPAPQAIVAAASGSGDNFYTVQKGDTAFGIAKRNNITMKQLMEWNHLNFEDIKIGQKLRVKP